MDYLVSNIDDISLQELLDNSVGTTYLKVNIKATDNTTKLKNSTNLSIVNNPHDNSAPPDPVPPIPPQPPYNWFNDGKNLAWFLPLTIGSVGIGISLDYYIYVRNKKGIGGKKDKKIEVRC